MTRSIGMALTLAVFGGIFTAAAADAQYYYGGNRNYGNYDGGYHSSTAAEGYARGLGDVIRARGEKNLNDSVAAGNLEDARSKYIDNRTKSVESYWTRRSIYDQKVAEQAYADQQRREAYFAKTLLKPLGNTEFDASTGAVSWPSVCREDSYNSYRSTVDGAFNKLATSGLLSMEEYSQASQAIKAWRQAITADKDLYPAEAVSQALRFLIKLNRELESQLG